MYVHILRIVVKIDFVCQSIGSSELHVKSRIETTSPAEEADSYRVVTGQLADETVVYRPTCHLTSPYAHIGEVSVHDLS